MSAMSSKARERVMRCFLAALLQSELSRTDLQNLSDELRYGSLSEELSDLLAEAMLKLAQAQTPKASSRQNHSGSEIQAAMQLISERKLPKKNVLQALTSASPWLSAEKSFTELPTRNILERYFRTASQLETRKFLALLNGEAGDPYLKGISKRS